MENLTGVAIGGLIGFLSAIGLEAIKRRWSQKESEVRVKRLVEMLYEEVEQIAELIDIDFGLIESDDIGFVVGFGKGDEEYDGKLKITIARIMETRAIFDSQSEKLLEIPGYLPNALVRFYTRVQVNFRKLDLNLSDQNLEMMQEIRNITLAEAESLKHEMRVLIAK